LYPITSRRKNNTIREKWGYLEASRKAGEVYKSKGGEVEKRASKKLSPKNLDRWKVFLYHFTLKRAIDCTFLRRRAMI
jgi:hypothetical protein